MLEKKVDFVGSVDKGSFVLGVVNALFIIVVFVNFFYCILL
jgi:hypothetical protein